MYAYSVANEAISATKYVMDRLQPGEIRVFSYDLEPETGAFWLIVTSKTTYKVVSWSSEVPSSSVEDPEVLLNFLGLATIDRKRNTKAHVRCFGSVSVSARHAHIEPIN